MKVFNFMSDAVLGALAVSVTVALQIRKLRLTEVKATVKSLSQG